MKRTLILILFTLVAAQIIAQTSYWERDSTTLPNLTAVIDYHNGWLAYQTNNAVEVYTYDATNDFQQWGTLTSPNPAHTDFGKAIAIHGSRMAISSGDVVYTYEWDGTNWAQQGTLTEPTLVQNNNGIHWNARIEITNDVMAIAGQDDDVWDYQYGQEDALFVVVYELQNNSWMYQDAFPLTFVNPKSLVRDSLTNYDQINPCCEDDFGQPCIVFIRAGAALEVTADNIFVNTIRNLRLSLHLEKENGTWGAYIPLAKDLMDGNRPFITAYGSDIDAILANDPNAEVCPIDHWVKIGGAHHTAMSGNGSLMYYTGERGFSLDYGGVNTYDFDSKTLANPVNVYSEDDSYLPIVGNRLYSYLNESLFEGAGFIRYELFSGQLIDTALFVGSVENVGTQDPDVIELGDSAFIVIGISSEFQIDTSAHLFRLATVTGRAKKLYTQVHISPNPATDLVTISTSANSPLQLEMVNSIGQTVMTQDLSAIKRDHTLDISHLPAGVYIVKVRGEQGQFVQRLVKE